MQRTQFVCPCGVLVLFLAFMLSLSGCGDSNPDKGINVKAAFPATGKVLVDGKAPSESEIPPVQIVAHPLGDAAADQPVGRAGTKPDGSFEFTTYRQGDGLPPGEYTLTFKSTKVNLLNPGLPAEDHLGGQYLDAKTSAFKVTVSESGEVQGLDSIDLKKADKPVVLQGDLD